MLLSNPGNYAKQPVKHWQATPATMAGNVTGNPAIATLFPAIVDASTLSELIILSNSAPNHNESRPAFHPIRYPII